MRAFKAVATGVAAVTLGGLVTFAAPQAAFAEDDFCRTTPGSNDFYDGPSASATYDDTFHPSVAIPAGVYDDRFVPQGLAYWNNWNGTDEDILLISAYDDDDGNKDPDGPSAIFGVVLSGDRRERGLGRMLIPETHAGGIAIAGGYVYVSGEGVVRRWTAATVRNYLEGPNSNTTVGSVGTPTNVAGKASYLGTQGGYVWAGDFDSPSQPGVRTMYRYSVGSGGALVSTGVSRPTPGKAQGMAAFGDRFVWATSEGQGDRGNIWVRPQSTTTAFTDGTAFCTRAPSMIEGLAYGNSNGNVHVWAIFEGGAYTYPDAINRIKHVHWANASDLAALYGLGD